MRDPSLNGEVKLRLVWFAAVDFSALALFVVIYSITSGKFLLALSVLLLVSMAAAAIGGLLGFLFGIPRSSGIAQSNGQTVSAASETAKSADREFSAFVSNSNLADVSNWLTKLLVGAGFASFGTGIKSLGALSGSISALLGIATIPPLVVVVILYGVVSGFIVAYLWTVVRARLLLEETEWQALQRVHKLIDMVAGRTRLQASDTEVAESRQVKSPSKDVKQRLTEADQLVGRLSLRHPNAIHASEHRTLARELKGAGRFEDAVEAYLRAFDADRTDPGPLIYAGLISSISLHNLGRAERLFSQALRVDPNNLQARYNLACTKARMGKADAALEALKSVIESNPDMYIRLAKDDSTADGCFAALAGHPTFRQLIGERSGE